MEADAKVDLRGKVAVVTGGTSGIGLGVALRFVQAGARVAVSFSRDLEQAQRAKAALERHDRGVLVRQADVASESAVEAFVAEVESELGGIDILVNNAGVLKITPLLELEESEWDWVVDTNLKGYYLCARAVARRMVAGGSGGSIVNITSVLADRPLPGRTHYGASKAGIINMTRVWAAELAPFKIRVNAVAPGTIETGMMRVFAPDPAQLPDLVAPIPLGRIGTPLDVGDAVLFLASSLAGYVTGTTLWVDGGLTSVAP